MNRPTGLRFAVAALAQALMFAVTLFPPMVLSLIAVYSVVLVFALTETGTRQARIHATALLCAIPVLGFLLVAFLYLPIFEAHFQLRRYCHVIRSASDTRLQPRKCAVSLHAQALLAVLSCHGGAAGLAPCRG